MLKKNCATGVQLRPLTTAQRGVYFAHLLDKSGVAYNTAHYRDINGAVDLEVFSQAVDAALNCVPAYCVSVVLHEEIPCARDFGGGELVLSHLDVSQEPEPLAAAMRWMECERNLAFDFEVRESA